MLCPGARIATCSRLFRQSVVESSVLQKANAPLAAVVIQPHRQRSAQAFIQRNGKVGIAVCDAVTAAVFQYFHLHIATAGNAVVALQRLVCAGCKCKFPSGEFCRGHLQIQRNGGGIRPRFHLLILHTHRKIQTMIVRVGIDLVIAHRTIRPEFRNRHILPRLPGQVGAVHRRRSCVGRHRCSQKRQKRRQHSQNPPTHNHTSSLSKKLSNRFYSTHFPLFRQGIWRIFSVFRHFFATKKQPPAINPHKKGSRKSGSLKCIIVFTCKSSGTIYSRLKNKAQASGRSDQLSLQLFCQKEFLRRLL